MFRERGKGGRGGADKRGAKLKAISSLLQNPGNIKLLCKIESFWSCVRGGGGRVGGGAGGGGGGAPPPPPPPRPPHPYLY